MLETSKDLLFISLAFCALFFTAFVCILLWQFISIISNIRGLTSGIKQKLDMVDDLLKTLKEKIASSASYVALIVNAVEKIVDHLQNKKSTAGRRKTKTEEK